MSIRPYTLYSKTPSFSLTRSSFDVNYLIYNYIGDRNDCQPWRCENADRLYARPDHRDASVTGTAAIDAALERAIAQQITPGAVLAVGQDGQRLYCRARGHASLVPFPQPMQEETLFDLASLTKVLATTILAMRCYETGILELDRPLGDSLPAHYPPDKATLTPRLLLLHAAGFPAHIPFYRELSPEPEDPATQRGEVLLQIRQTPLAYPPGTETRYSDLGMILLGEFIEQLVATSLDRFFEAQVAEPLGLQHTFFIHLDAPLSKARRAADQFAATERCTWRDALIRGAVHDENACLLRGVAGHAGLFSTITDLQILATTLLNGLAGRDPFLSADTLEFFTARQEIVPGSERALGWGTPAPGASCGQHFSPRAFGHTGFTGTSVWLDPLRDRYVILLTNRVHPTRDNTRLLDFRPRFHDLIIETLESL